MATIQPKERVKVQQLVHRIESGNFDCNDVDGLLIKLRPYANNRMIFREITDFVAHADSRNKGITCESITGFSDSMRYFVEYVSPRKTLDISKPFPSYIRRLFRSQALLVDAAALREKFRLSPQSLIKKIDRSFTIDKKNRLCVLEPGSHGIEFIGALKYITSFIISKPAFEISAFHAQLYDVLADQKIKFDSHILSMQADRVSLALLCLLSGTKFVLPDGGIAECSISTEHHFRILTGKRRLPIGEITSEPSQFGNLQLQGTSHINYEGKNLSVAFPVVMTHLSPHDHCDQSLFDILFEENEFGEFRIEIIKFESCITLTPEFKIINAATFV